MLCQHTQGKEANRAGTCSVMNLTLWHWCSSGSEGGALQVLSAVMSMLIMAQGPRLLARQLLHLLPRISSCASKDRAAPPAST